MSGRRVRPAAILVALALTSGCVRLGYDARRGRSDAGPDASQRDAAPEVDGGVAGAGGHEDASSLDGNVQDASTDAATVAADGGDANAMLLDAAEDAMPGSMDDGGGDAGDGATEDGAVDSGPSGLCPELSGVLFCDGFEDPEFSRWSYDVVTNGTLTQTTERVRSGAASLRATTGNDTGTNNVARYGARPFAHVTSGDLWLRSYYFIPSSTVVSPAFSTCVVAEVEQPYFGFSLVVRPDSVDIGALGTFYAGTMEFPRDRWVCVELHVQIDASAGIFEAYLDSELAVRSPATDTLPAMGYTSIDLGIHYTEPGQGPVTLYVDDVVAGTTRAGCD